MSNQDPYQQRPGPGWSPAVPSPFGQATDASAPAPYGQAVPAYGAPAYGSPVYGAPAYGAPSYGNPGLQYPGFVGAVMYAPWIQRVGAYLLDSLVMLPYVVVLMVAPVALSEPGFDRYGNPTVSLTPAGLGLMAVTGLVGSLLWGWNRWYHAGRTGQSWGKKVVGLTLQDDRSGLPIGGWVAFARDVAHYVDGFLYLGYLWPLWDVKRQTFSDKIVKSVVVR